LSPTKGDAISGGRGLGNIRLRAAKIGAQVDIASAQPGTSVTFSFKLEQGFDDSLPTDQAALT
jgi:signal transduction histidine kinase